MPEKTADNATLSETLDEAKELEAIRVDVAERLKPLRTLALHLVAAGKCSAEQAKTTKQLFPPRGRKPNKK